jgi:hypothetical protein
MQGVHRGGALARSHTYVHGYAVRACIWARTHAFRAGQDSVPREDGDGNTNVYQVIRHKVNT